MQLHGLYSPWNFPGQNTRVGSLSLLQGIFPTQGLNPGLLHYQVSHKGSAIITGVGSLLLLWQIFPSQESNQCLLHCRQILYQLSNQGIPTYQNTGSIVVVHRLSCSMTSGILPDQGLNSWAETGLLWMWAGFSCFLSSGVRYVGELLQLQ